MVALIYEDEKSNTYFANHFAKRAESLAKKMNFKMGIADAYLNLGSSLIDLSDNEKAIVTFNQAIKS